MKTTNLMRAFYATSTWVDSMRVFHIKVDGELVPLASMEFPRLNYFCPKFSKSEDPPKFNFKHGTATALDSENPYAFGIVNDFLAYGKDVKDPFKIKLDSHHKVINLTPYFCNYFNSDRGFYMARDYTTRTVSCTRSDIYLVPIN